MKFQKRANLRFDVESSGDDFNAARSEYYESLKSIDFTGRENVLKYFGESFFHDADIFMLQKTPKDGQLKITISSWNLLWDFNEFRKRNGLKELKSKYFWRNKPLYHFTFRDVSDCSFININSQTFMSILDTEISSENGRLTLSVNFSENEEFSITFNSMDVEIYSEERILKLTNGLTTEIPYCGICIGNMLSEESLKHYKPLKFEQ